MFGKGAPRCRRCNGAVYAAEEIIGAGQKWHTQCFSCKECKTRLSSTTLTEKEGEIYCTTCYAKAFGPKGYGIGGTGVLTGVSVADGSKPASSPSAGAGAGAGGAGSAFCTGCGQKNDASSKFCGGCGKPTGAAANAAASSPAAAPAAAAAPAPASGNFAANKPIQRPSFQVANTSSTKCGKCALSVYEAEKVVGGGRVWHQACFRCTTCRSGLNSTNLNDKEGQIYCNACYAKNFGPKGFGFSGGGATMHTQ